MGGVAPKGTIDVKVTGGHVKPTSGPRETPGVTVRVGRTRKRRLQDGRRDTASVHRKSDKEGGRWGPGNVCEEGVHLLEKGRHGGRDSRVQRT